MTKIIDINGRLIGAGQPTFIIAEAGANHNGDLDLARQLCRAAKDVGCDCIKFQTFTADEFCADPAQVFSYTSQGKIVTEPMIDLFRRLEFSRAQWAELMAYCDEIGILFLTTVQDLSNLEMMLELGLKGIKVGSDDFDHLINLRRYAQTGLPLIVSKGMATLAEVDVVVRAITTITSKLAMLHCVSLYPTEPENLNLQQIQTLQNLYPDVVWGFSDHSRPGVAPAIAVALGAKLIEKHFTLSHDLPGPDHWFSLNVNQMAVMITDIRFTERALGTGEVAPASAEADYKKLARRRIVAKVNLPLGAVLDEMSVTFKRGSYGAFVSDWDRVRGHRLRRERRQNDGIDFADVEFSLSASADTMP
jgi:N-acetylneuraminate synthase/N,N'-diacetyllegionaminate synthase